MSEYSIITVCNTCGRYCDDLIKLNDHDPGFKCQHCGRELYRIEVIPTEEFHTVLDDAYLR